MVKLFFKTILLTFLTFFFVFGFTIGNFNPFSNDWNVDLRFVLIITTILFSVVIFGINVEINDDN